MALYEYVRQVIERLPDLSNRPEFDMPWTLAKDRSHFYRLDVGGTIYRLDLPSGDVRRL